MVLVLAALAALVAPSRLRAQDVSCGVDTIAGGAGDGSAESETAESSAGPTESETAESSAGLSAEEPAESSDEPAPASRADEPPAPVVDALEPRSLADRAREALAQGAFAEAERVARAALAVDPADEAWGLLGMALFRQGAFERALRAYRCALALATPARRVLLRFNEASALYELERVAEAEEAFAALAAGEPPAGELAPLAAIDATFAALELGALVRAEEHLSRARTLGAARDFAGELSEAERALRAFQAEVDRAEAELSDAELSEADGAEEASSAPGEDASDGSAEVASSPAERAATTRGLRARGEGWSVQASLAGGVDSNPAQSGVSGTDALSLTAADTGPSGVVEIGFGFGYAGSVGARAFLSLDYAGEQLAYPERALDELSLQSHALAAEGELRVHEVVALRLGLEGDVLAAGLERFAPMVLEGGGTLRVDVEVGAHTTSAWYRGIASAALDAAYDFLAGHRHELMVEQRLRHPRVRGRLWAGWRGETAGDYRLPVNPDDYPECATHRCDALDYFIPLSHDAISFGGRLGVELVPALGIGAELGGELRYYREDFHIVTGRGYEFERSRKIREDQRLRARLELTWFAHAWVVLELYGELLRSWSNIDNGQDDEAHRFDYDDRNYLQLLGGLRLELSWPA